MGAIQRYITRKYLQNRGAEHLRHYPQVACFAFDLITNYIHLDGRYEPEQLDFIAKYIFPKLKSRVTALDVGANIGNHSLFFADHFSSVLSFEPHPRTFRLLDLNAELAKNVTAYNFGLSDEEAVQTAHVPSGNVGASSVVADDRDKPGSETQLVEFFLKPLDEVPEVSALESIDFIKVDVERHELQFFRGAEKTVKRHQPLIVMEVLAAEIENGDTPALKLLRDYGYTDFYSLRTNRPMNRAPNPVAKLATALLGLLLNYRPPKNFSLEPLKLQAEQNYPMIFCSTKKLL